MKFKTHNIGMLLLLASAIACKKDNFKAPSSLLQGRLMFNNDSINLEYDRVPFELYQYGFGRVGPISQSFAQDGTYSSLLFDGEYKMIVPNGQGPFMWPKTASGNQDSVTITMNGSKTLNIPVIPYYMPRNAMVTTRGRNVYASFKPQQIVGGTNGKAIEYVTAYVNKTQFVSGSDNVVSRQYGSDAIIDTNKIDFSTYVAPATVSQSYYFVRMGIKMSGVEDLIFTPLFKVNLGEVDNYARVKTETGTVVGGAFVDTLVVGEDKSRRYINNITANGSGVDIRVTIAVAGTYLINVNGATDVKGSTHSIYIDGNTASAKTVLYPKQGATGFDIAPVEFDLAAGTHVISIRKTATNTGKAQVEWIDLFRLK